MSTPAAQRARTFQDLLERVHAEFTRTSAAPDSDASGLDALAADLAGYYFEGPWSEDREDPALAHPGHCPTALYCEDCVYELLSEIADLLEERDVARTWR